MYPLIEPMISITMATACMAIALGGIQNRETSVWQEGALESIEHWSPIERKDGTMAVELNDRAVKNAERLIEEGKFVFDDRDAWSEHQPSAEDEDKYIDEHGYGEYGKWYLGINTDKAEGTKGRYEFPYGDFEKVHRCGVLSAEVRAGQYKHTDIENAAAHLHGMIDAARHKSAA